MSTFDNDLEFTVEVQHSKKDEDIPEISLYVLNETGKTIYQQSLCEQRRLSLPAKALKQAEKIFLTRTTEQLSEEDISLAKHFTKRQLHYLSSNNQPIGLARRDWLTWLPSYKICLHGKVRKCYWWPLLQKIVANNLPVFSQKTAFKKISKLPRLSLSTQAEALASINDFQLTPFRRCQPVCEGIVEIYERICCRTIIITPSIIDDLRDILRERLVEIPDLPIPPQPEFGHRPTPDPIPFEAQALFKKGAADQVQMNAASDLQALATLPLQQAQDYILARPYLIDIITHCGDPVLKGAVALGEGGEFDFCYSSITLLSINPLRRCRREVAFKVIQNTGSGSRVIYDGVSAGQWFEPSDDGIVLSNYDPKAIACEPATPVPGPDGAYVALARIGTGTDSVHLDSPDQTGDHSVLAPFSATAGLAFPESNLNLAKGKKKNLNWGGVLPIRIDFSKGMANTKAKYYRIGIAKANTAGQPISSTQEYLDDAITWYYNDPEFVGGGFTVKRKTFPLTNSANPTFHTIPYDKLIPSDASWRDNQYHGFIDTRDFENERYLVTIEVFDASFKRVVPSGTGTVVDEAEPFSYETWNHIDHTSTVPYAALTHLFWWDNRVLTTKIEDLRKNGVPSSEECQFLQKPATATDALFSTGFRAYHQQHGTSVPDFLMSWKLKWKRGLGGAQDTLDSGVDSVGFGANPEISAAEQFSTMLNLGLPAGQTNAKCTFSLMLFAAAKTWNGSDYVEPNALKDVASFALDNS